MTASTAVNTTPTAATQPTATTAPEASPTPEAAAIAPSSGTPQPATTGACANPFVPVKEGATWTYRNTGGPVSPATFTTTITAAHSDSFTVATKFDDSATADQEWSCTPAGLLATSLGAGQTALGLSLQGIQAELTTNGATGVTIPRTVEPGQKWSQALDISGTLAQGSLNARVKGSVTTDFVASGNAVVTVPAGTFTAMRVDSKSYFKIIADYHGLSIPITSIVNTSFWFAPGVGWIKSAENGELAGTAVNSVTELQSYSIP